MKQKVFSILALLLMAVTGAMAQDVLYAEVSGTEMTLKYGTKSDGAIEFTGVSTWDSSFRLSITTATVDASCQNYNGTTLANLFHTMNKLTTINGLTNLNTANVTKMQDMFFGCSALTSLDLSGFNTASVTDMGSMFFGCSALTSLDLSAFNTANVNSMHSMFNIFLYLRTEYST